MTRHEQALRNMLELCARMERGVGYRVSGQHDTWDSYTEGKHDFAMQMMTLIEEALR